MLQYIKTADSIIKDLSGHISPEIDDSNLSTNIGKLIHYLSSYGYIDNQKTPTLIDIVAGTMKLKSFFKVQSTALIDAKLLGLVNTSRCAVPDFMRTEAARWRKTNLTYYIARRDSDLPADVWDAQIERAWSYWMAVANIKITRTNNANNADIVHDIGQGQRDNFDGPSGTLAWAYLPNGRDQQLLNKFDISETWITSDMNSRGVRLLNVCTHEFGHLLGLTHSQIQSALMAPYYSANIATPQTNDDIPRIQSLYGPATESPNPTPSPTPTPTPPNNPQDEIIIKLKGSVVIPGYRLTKIQ